MDGLSDTIKQLEREQFYNYLRSIGFRDNGANEVINRLETNRPDREDIRIYKDYRRQNNEDN